MQRTLIVCAALLLGSTILGATVFREQVAHAAQAILQVRVVNTANEPVPVRGTIDVNGPVQVSSGQPYQETVSFNQSPTTCTQFVCRATFATVPAGKQLVITYVSAHYGLSPGGTLASIDLGIDGSFSLPFIELPATRLGFDTYLANGPVTFYVDAGHEPTVDMTGQFVQPASLTAAASIVGYLVPAS